MTKTCETSPINSPTELQIARSRYFGELVTAIVPSRRQNSRPISDLASSFLPAFRHGQYRIFYDVSGEPTGFVLWATLAEESHSRMLRTASPDLHISEWNEGSYLWIIEFSALPESLCAVLRECEQMFANFGWAVICKRYSDRRAFRMIVRSEFIEVLERLERRHGAGISGPVAPSSADVLWKGVGASPPRPAEA